MSPQTAEAAAGAAAEPAAGTGRGGFRGLLARANTPAVRTRLGTLAGVAILAVLFWRLGTGAFVDGIRRIDGPTVLAALGIGLVTTVFSAWRWALVARGIGIRLPLGAAVADYYRALFLNAALPGESWGTCTVPCGTARTRVTWGGGCGRWCWSGRPASSRCSPPGLWCW